MTKLIKNWKELSKIPPNNKYKIEVDSDYCCGWIKPINENDCSDKEYFENYCYLSTHTFYGNKYKESTKILQKFGFDIEIDNWDK